MIMTLQTRLLRNALVVLSLPPAEQQRLNGPGCLTCDMFDDYQSAWKALQHDSAVPLTSDQWRSLEVVSQALDALSKHDCECLVARAVYGPAWQAIREKAGVALRLLGWRNATVEPFFETSPDVWTRPPDSADAS
jgi:hypothetical protein